MTVEQQLIELQMLNRVYIRQRNELLGFYQELRQLYYDATGFDFIPSSLVGNRYAPTEEDRTWLKSIGIDIDKFGC